MVTVRFKGAVLICGLDLIMKLSSVVLLLTSLANSKNIDILY